MRSINNLINCLLDSNIHHLVTIVGENDVNEVLANIVDIAFYCCQKHSAATSITGLLHVRLEVGNRRLHHFSALQNKGKLHLAFTEEFSYYLHTFEQVIVNDC